MKCLGVCLMDLIFILGTAFPSQAVFGYFHENLFPLIHAYGFLENNVICRFISSCKYISRILAEIIIIEGLSCTLHRKCLMGG